ncbi:hypothetical protein CAPTEDRAFT_214605, partial [Capitella teleta]
MKPHTFLGAVLATFLFIGVQPTRAQDELRIVTSPRDTNVVEDGTVSFFCEVTGNPKPEIHWAKDNRRVHSLRGRITVYETPNGSVLRIKSVRTGIDEVRRVPPLFTIIPTDVEVTPGGSANLTCAAVGAPTPYVRWRLGSVDPTPEDPVPFGVNVLELNDIWESGTYTCIATSDLGVIRTDVCLHLIGLAATPVNVAISEVTGTSLKLTWSPGSEDPIDSYRITYKQIFADSDMSTRVNVQSTEYTVTGLSPRAIYEFRVAAVNSFGIGRPSIPVNVITAEI